MAAILLLAVLTLLMLGLLVIFFSGLLATALSRVPYVPTRKDDIAEMIERVGITNKDVFIDLGSGDGRVVFLVADLTGAAAWGYEFPSWMHWYAQLKKRLTRSSANFVAGNFFKHQWPDPTIVYCYLMPQLLPQVSSKIRETVKPGTRVISRGFPVPELALVEEWKSPSGHTMFLYHV